MSTEPTTSSGGQSRSRRFAAASWLSEAKRSGVSGAVAILIGLPAIAILTRSTAITMQDSIVVVLVVYLPTYLGLTHVAFIGSTPRQIDAWAERESRGTPLQRYVLGTAPGPGASILACAAALVVAVIWLPGYGGSSIPEGARIGIAIGLVLVAWVCVLVSFAVTFCADNLLEDGRALDFPGPQRPAWPDYLYFACSVMTTFGTTDVTVASRAMRKTVVVNALVAFVFNTVIVATVVSVLA